MSIPTTAAKRQDNSAPGLIWGRLNSTPYRQPSCACRQHRLGLKAASPPDQVSALRYLDEKYMAWFRMNELISFTQALGKQSRRSVGSTVHGMNQKRVLQVLDSRSLMIYNGVHLTNRRSTVFWIAGLGSKGSQRRNGKKRPLGSFQDPNEAPSKRATG